MDRTIYCLVDTFAGIPFYYAGFYCNEVPIFTEKFEDSVKLISFKEAERLQQNMSLLCQIREYDERGTTAGDPQSTATINEQNRQDNLS